MADRLTVLVTGATGKQGGSVARTLLARGHRVRALTRRPDSEAAQSLAALGAEPFAGDLRDAASVSRAMDGADAAFAMSTPFEAGMEAEVRQGRTLVDAARSAGLPHLVFTSVAASDQNTGIPHFDSKWEIEQYLAASGVPFSVIAPAFFMENVFFGPSPAQTGVLAIPLPGSLRMQQVALADIGGFASVVLEHRSQFLGRRVEIASDDLTCEQCAAILAKVIGKPIGYFQVPLDQVRAMSEDLAIMYEWLTNHGYRIDVEALRRDFPQVGWKRYEEWARAQRW